MSFMGATAGLGAGVAGHFLGKAFGNTVDPNEAKNPFAGTEAGARANKQIELLNSYNQQPFRDAQIGQLEYLQQQATGQGQSIAQMQADRMAQQLYAQQIAQAQNAPAMQAAMARRNAAQNTAQGQADIGGQAMMARLQEIQNANQMLAQASGQGRSQDFASQGLAQNYEQMLAQAALQAQAQKLGLMQGNVQSQNQTGAAFTNAIGSGMAAGGMFGGHGISTTGGGGGGSPAPQGFQSSGAGMLGGNALKFA